MNLGDRIRKMCRYRTTEEIAEELGLELEVVEGIISGSISDDALSDYNPDNKIDIRIVEKKTFVRSSVIGLISLGSSGGTTLTASLASVAALSNSESMVTAVDYNEFSTLGSSLGIQYSQGNYPSLAGWAVTETVDQYQIRHPAIKNLKIVLGPGSLNSYFGIPVNRMLLALDSLGKSNDSVWVDCPRSPNLWQGLIKSMDIICFVVKPEGNSLYSLAQTAEGIEGLDKDKTFVVIRRDNEKEGLDIKSCIRIIENMTNLKTLGIVPYVSEMNKCTNSEQNFVLANKKSVYTGEILSIVRKLTPASSVGITKKFKNEEGIKGLFHGR